MFPPLQAEVDARFESVEAFFRATRALRGDPAAAARGLVFVQVYGAYEFTVKEVIRVAIESINAHNHRIGDMSPSLITLFLDREFRSLRDAGRSSIWESRLAFVSKAFSNDVAVIPSTTKGPHDGSHYRYSQLELMFQVFGISRLPVRRRTHRFRINEVVRHRNEISHGNETPETAGRTYTSAEVRKMIRQMRSVCNLLVSVFDGFCSDRNRHRR